VQDWLGDLTAYWNTTIDRLEDLLANPEES
jgi:hypothetical protein